MKCLKYWPDESTRQFGMITVRMKDQEMFSEFVLRTFEINQVQFDRINRSKSVNDLGLSEESRKPTEALLDIFVCFTFVQTFQKLCDEDRKCIYVGYTLGRVPHLGRSHNWADFTRYIPTSRPNST